MTAVIEFLSAFVLFLVIVSAFLSLSRLHLGPNQPIVDRLDDDAVNGLMSLTTSSGWFVPHDENDDRDADNGTADWHLASPNELAAGDLLPGLASATGELDSARLAGLANITADQMRVGLGLPEWTALNLTIRVVDSDQSDRIGIELFSDGPTRRSATRSSTSSRLMPLEGEIVRVSLEVLDSAGDPDGLRMTEFMPDPALGSPEWVEVYNEPGFAVDLLGVGLARNGLYSMIGGGILPGNGILLLTGDIDTQITGNASLVIDLSSNGLLGRGSLDGLKVPSDSLRLTHNEYGSATTMQIQRVDYNATWGFDEDYSAVLVDHLSQRWEVGSDSNPGDL